MFRITFNEVARTHAEVYAGVTPEVDAAFAALAAEYRGYQNVAGTKEFAAYADATEVADDVVLG